MDIFAYSVSYIQARELLKCDSGNLFCGSIPSDAPLSSISGVLSFNGGIGLQLACSFLIIAACAIILFLKERKIKRADNKEEQMNDAAPSLDIEIQVLTPNKKERASNAQSIDVHPCEESKVADFGDQSVLLSSYISSSTADEVRKEEMSVEQEVHMIAQYANSVDSKSSLLVHRLRKEFPSSDPKNLKKNKIAVKRITFRVKDGEVVGVLGNETLHYFETAV
jgi:hypothetical protein